MPLIRIVHYPGSRQAFIASEEISHLAVVEISAVGPNYAALGSVNTSGRVCGVAWGAQSGAVSGKVMRVLTQGIASGVVCASSINAGQRVMAVSGGRINVFSLTSGLQPVLSGAAASILPLPLGKALASGTKGGGIPVLVTLGS